MAGQGVWVPRNGLAISADFSQASPVAARFVAKWDQAPVLTRDSQNKWDAVRPIHTPKKMVKRRTALASLKPEVQIAKMVAVMDGLTTHAATFAPLAVSLVTSTVNVTEITDNAAAILVNDALAASLRLTRDTLLGEGPLIYEQNAGSVTGKAGDDAAMAVLSAYDSTLHRRPPDR
jgi:hypothetical protein